VSEGVVDKGVGSRDKRRIDCGDTLDTKLPEESAELHIQSLCDIRVVGLSIKLHRIDPMCSCLAVPQSAGSSEAVIRTGKYGIGKKAKGRSIAFDFDLSLDTQPVLLQQKIVCSIVKAERKLIAGGGAGGKGTFGPAIYLQIVTLEEASQSGASQGRRQQPTIR